MSFQFSPSLLKEEGGVRGRSSAYGIKRQAKRGGWKKGITDASTSYTTFFLLEREGRRKMGPSKLSPRPCCCFSGQCWPCVYCI